MPLGRRISNTASNGDNEAGAALQPSRKARLVEVVVFLFLIVPSMVFSSFTMQRETPTFSYVAIAGILQDLALLSLVLFFVWRNGESPKSIGLTTQSVRREIFMGIGLFFPYFLGIGLTKYSLRSLGLPVPEEPPSYMVPSGQAEFLLAIGFLVVIAVSEEVIFRGYLMLRFGGLMASPTGAVLLSAAIFALGHGYQGIAGTVTVGAAGAVFALIYLWRGSLVAPMVMHFTQDFLSIILVPLGMAV